MSVDEISPKMLELGKKAKEAARKLATISEKEKNRALLAMADALEKHSKRIIEENSKDLENGRSQGISKALMDRLLLNEARIKEMAQGLRDVAKLKDPVGEVIEGWKRPNGLMIYKVRVPIGVIAMIYEARPNVTVDAAGLCLKSGNAVILRGSSIAFNSNSILTEIISEAAESSGIPAGAIQQVPDTSRKSAEELMRMVGYVDCLIPRGGADLIKTVVQNAKVPTIETGVGNDHIYVDKSADFEKAYRIVINAKCQRPGVCNAAETMLVHREIASDFLPRMLEMLKENGVTIYGCEETKRIVPWVEEATEKDWETEYLDLKIAVKVVKDVDEAIDHISKYGTLHTEAIITEDYTVAQKFVSEVDASLVLVNASTRFNDGGQFGFGAEIGISTQKLHARGPMALRELTTYKYIAYGNGQVRE
ncbi:MAG: glutamate-5-semialdehyde dehydrogenase [Actinobacteria bacterium]|nr:glutamate-5-semialdehyde dehydrogenase [Actinomycetota bacterium]